MKELSIEEKAKRYDEAKARMSIAYNSNRCTIGFMNEIFPELKENEDERIRKGLLSYFKKSKIGTFNGMDAKAIIAWLEKQGEQKQPKELTNSEFVEKCKGLSLLEKHILAFVPTRPIDAIKVDARTIRYLVEQEQGEQKPVEWSTNDEFVIKILNTVCDEYLKISTYKGTEFRHEIIGAINWLKSLKDRVQLQNLTVTDKELAQAKKDAYNDALDKIEYHSGEPTFDDGWNAAIWYLKKRNAQPKNTWKPSDKQMEALKEACDEHWEPDGLDPLYILWEQLKKLREK